MRSTLVPGPDIGETSEPSETAETSEWLKPLDRVLLRLGTKPLPASLLTSADYICAYAPMYGPCRFRVPEIPQFGRGLVS